MRIARALIVVALSAAYFGALFRLTDATFWNSGLGDWQDPYFINFILEHWYRSALRLTDPVSPPMFFPAPNALGYSCSLILYAPFYFLVRPFVDAFQAYGLALFLVAETGTIVLYLLFRRWMRLDFAAALVLTAYFVTTQNIVNGLMFAWSQRATVFLIPIVILLIVESRRLRPGPWRTVLALAAGCLCALVPTNDFPSGYLAALVALIAFGPALVVAAPPHLRRGMSALPSSRASRLLLLLAAGAAVWALAIAVTGGVSTQFAGVRISSRDWVRPAVVAALALAGSLYSDKLQFAHAVVRQTRTWGLPFTIGLTIGAAIFLRIYLHAYREHPTFPREQMLDVLTPASRLLAYDSARPFILVLVITALAWLPWSGVGRRARAAALWFLAAAVLVLLMPLRFGDVSLWTSVVQLLPGAGGVRDATRIMDPFELAIVLGTGLLLAWAPSRRMRLGTMAVAATLLVSGWRFIPFDYSRPNATYAQWVEAPIAVDPSCRAFFMLPASRTYAERPNSAWSVYALDAMFIALRHDIPTLNGYSGWTPEGWAVANPDAPGYLDVAARWIRDHRLSGVCALDIERRTMTPFRGGERE